MTQDEFEPARVEGANIDLIKNLDRYTFDIRQRVIWFIRHFTSNKWCPLCEDIIKIYKEDDSEDFDIHMHSRHNDEEILRLYIEMYKKIKDHM